MTEEVHVRPSPSRKESISKKLTSYLKFASDVAGIVMSVRDNPTRMDWASFGMRAANLGVSWYTDRHRRGRIVPAWDYFNADEKWTTFPREYAKIVLSGAQNLRVADEYLDSDVKVPYACLADLGSESIGWSVADGQIDDGPYYKENRTSETFVALGKMLWRSLGGKHLLYAPDGLVLDTFRDTNIIPTRQMGDLLDRVTAFMRAGERRGYLLGGVPGTGKSVTIRWLVNALNLTSVRIDLRLLSEDVDSRGGSISASLETMLRVLQPDVMILDDLDRIKVSSQVLAVLERARQTCRVVIASANAVSELSGAASRPGRFDDILEFSTLDQAVVAKILGAFGDLADQVCDLPAAYVAEFAARCRVLGREQALEDLGELRERAEVTAEDSAE